MLGVSIVIVSRRLRDIAPGLFGRGVGEMTVVPLDDDDTRIDDWPAVWAVLIGFFALIAVTAALLAAESIDRLKRVSVAIL